MDTLWLTPEQARAIGRHALDDAPREACGIVAGLRGRALRVIPVANISPEPERHYVLDHATLGKVLLSLEREGLEVAAFYHSHPEGEPIPSQTDIALASYPDTPYLIVGLRTGAPELAAWRIRYGEVTRQPVHVGTSAPVAEAAPLSPAQKVAIIVSAALAVALLLIISLSLLPPAPELPLR